MFEYPYVQLVFRDPNDRIQKNTIRFATNEEATNFYNRKLSQDAHLKDTNPCYVPYIRIHLHLVGRKY